MDEPTNHLDIESSETLIHALRGYGGTLLFVSHNQSFVNSLATKIWDIRGRGIVEYPGRLEEYYDHRRKVERPPWQKGCRTEDTSTPRAMTAGEKTESVSNTGKRDRKNEKREKAIKRQIIHDTLNPIRKRLEQVEERIAALESRQQEVEKMLADPHIFADEEISVPLLSEYRDIREELDERLLQWEETQYKLESTKKCLGVQD